jgi:hypothetical protein
MFDVCTFGHTHASSRQSSFCHTLISTRPVCTFSFTKAPLCLELLIPATNAVGRCGIPVELLPECPLKRNNWYRPHKLQHTKRFQFRSRHYRCVTSQTERDLGRRNCACAQNGNTRCCFPCGKLSSAWVFKAVIEDWIHPNHFDTPCISHGKINWSQNADTKGGMYSVHNTESKQTNDGKSGK